MSDANPRPPLHDRRPEMTVCRTCDQFREKDRARGEPLRRYNMMGRPPEDWRKECTWFQTSAGRAASSDQRMAVMVAGANGGSGCPVMEGESVSPSS